MLRTVPSHEKWKPKQCVEIEPSVFLELAPGASLYLAAYLLNICPKIVPGSIIHDNACGTGVVTNEIMKAIPSAVNRNSGISIHVTNLSPEMVEACQIMIHEHGWSDMVNVSLMGMQSLTFPDEMFTHSFANFAIFSLPDDETAQTASHIYRTLKPGGTAALTT